MMPGPLAVGLIIPLAGRLADRLDPRIPIGLGVAICSGGIWQFSYLTLQSGYWDLFWPQLWRGIGFGLVFVPLASATLGSISNTKRTSASGLYNLIAELGGSTGIAGLSLMLQYLEVFHFSHLTQGVNQNALHQQAMLLVYSDLFRYSALIFLASYVPLFFLKVKRTSNTAQLI